MQKFMMAYHGGRKPQSKEEGMEHMNKWKTWVQSLGDTVLNPGTPLPTSQLVTADSVTEDADPNAMKGFAVIQTETMEAAVEISKSDPFLDTGGTIRVSQMMEMG